MESIRKFFNRPHESFFLFGPQGTGKSTFVKKNFQMRFISICFCLRHSDYFLLIPRVFENISRQSRIRKQFVLTGSSSLKLKRAWVDLLAGRAILCFLHLFITEELHDQFSLEIALEFGLLPIVLDSKNPNGTLKHISEKKYSLKALYATLDIFPNFLRQ